MAVPQGRGPAAVVHCRSCKRYDVVFDMTDKLSGNYDKYIDA